MSFKTYRDIPIILNGQHIFANSISISEDADLSSTFIEGQRISENNIVNNPIRAQLSLSYYLTGKCPLKDYLLTNADYSLSGNIGGLNFNQGYVQSYSLNASPHEPVVINSNLLITDELSGIFSANYPTNTPSDLKILSFNDATLSGYTNYSAFSIENIIGLNWNYTSEITPVYYYQQTGANHINPDRIIIGKKEISTEIISDNTNVQLPYSGENFGLDLIISHPTISSITEIYSCSGKISSKNLNSSNDGLVLSNFKIVQSHINNIPIISGVDTSTYPINNYILIDSVNANNNGFFTPYNKLPIVEKIILGDRNLTFTLDRYPTFDRITGYIPNDAINGTLQIHTTKGLIIYPSGLILNYPNITISGFSPETGNYHDIITVSGSNLYRITDVKINKISTRFQVSKNNTGNNTHSLIFSIPDNTSVGKIDIISSLRNKSGSSTGYLYPIIEITKLDPPTGIWGNVITISGKNFSGITNLYFNNISSPSFGIINVNTITGKIPLTGEGYTKGYVTVIGHNGTIGKSQQIYRPNVPIFGISTISGGIDSDLRISTIIDTGFLSLVSGGGYKVAFGNVTGRFYPSGSGALTGLIPSGWFMDQFISLYEPDGLNKYTSFTGRFTQIGPIPIIDSISPTGVLQYKSYSLSINGDYFKDFFGLNRYILISGFGNEYSYTTNDFSSNSFYNKITLNNVRITGSTGKYDIFIINYAGSGKFKTGLFVDSAVDQARFNSTASQQPDTFLPAANAIDGGGSGSKSYSCTKEVSSQRGGIWISTFNQPITVSKINIYQSNIPQSIVLPGQKATNVSTGFVELYDINNNVIFGFGTGVKLNGYVFTGLKNPISGVKQIRIYSSGLASTYGTNHICLALNTVEVY